jgi:streptomycin 6-kinase
MRDGLSIPEYLARAVHADGRQEWLDTFPNTIKEFESRWSLTAGEPFQPGGRTAWVAPVLWPCDVDLVVKIARRHGDSLQEADAFRVWDGDGAVHVHEVEAFPEATGLLLERCRPGTTLAHLPELEQDNHHRGFAAPPSGVNHHPPIPSVPSRSCAIGGPTSSLARRLRAA